MYSAVINEQYAIISVMSEILDKFLELLYQLVNYLAQVFILIAPLAILVAAWAVGQVLARKIADTSIDGVFRRRRFKKMGNNATRDEMLVLLSALHPKEFEYYVADIMKKNGYAVKVVGGYGKGDGGVDIVAKKDGRLSYVQCKKFIGKDIGVAMMRDFYGAIADSVHALDARGIYVTTTRYTDDAKKFARAKKIRLYDGDDLIDLIFARELKGEQISTGERARGEVLRNTPPTCPACKKDLAIRKKDDSIFFGCTGYPECRYMYSLNASQRE